MRRLRLSNFLAHSVSMAKIWMLVITLAAVAFAIALRELTLRVFVESLTIGATMLVCWLEMLMVRLIGSVGLIER